MRRRRFGQHFLRDPSAIAHIINAINPAADDTIVEIGPGDGALTAPLLESGARLCAIEIDRDWAAHLQQRFPRLELICADILKSDWGQWLRPGVRVVGNLPYNISTPLLLRLAREAAQMRDMHIMVQREVGQRLAAACACAEYGRLTVSVALTMKTERLFDVPPGAFSPPPKVMSSVLRLTPRPGADAPPMFDDVVRLAFSQRRKMVGKALADINIDWARAGVDARKRAEQLTLDDYRALADSVIV